MNQLQDYDLSLHLNKHASSTATPINVIHVAPAAVATSADTTNTQNMKTIRSPPNSPPVLGTQIEVHHVGKKENSENTSPNVASATSTSYFKISRSSSSLSLSNVNSVSSNSTCVNSEKGSSILVFN